MCFVESTPMPRPSMLLSVAEVVAFPAVFGKAPTKTTGGVCPHPEVLVPLQVAPLITDTVRSIAFPTKTVLVAVTTPTERGAFPTVIFAGIRWQPEVFAPLQVLPLITETVLSLVFVT